MSDAYVPAPPPGWCKTHDWPIFAGTRCELGRHPWPPPGPVEPCSTTRADATASKEASDESVPQPAGTSRTVYRTASGSAEVGVNTDKADPDACVEAAIRFGYDSGEDRMIAHYAGQRWQRGEEAEAINMMLHHGIDLTSCYAIIAYGRAAAYSEPTAEDR